MSRLYVVDNTVLSNFARIQHPELLELAVAPDAITPPTVRHELRLGENLGVLPRLDWQWLPTATLDTVEQALAEELRVGMDAGEAECLALAIHRKGVIVTDDRGARQKAAQRGVEMSGTIGVLKNLVRDGHLTLAEADGYLGALIAQGFRSPVESLKQLA